VAENVFISGSSQTCVALANKFKTIEHIPKDIEAWG
jgi:hypothetical protein